ncbi:MAG: hypothetical protein DAHOPDDO_02032 [Ignavibacteriaceae bacterium]|nr:hypothetical protein [Ignavibacteriaceae bacterium]
MTGHINAMELKIQQIEINSKFINDIVEVRRLRAILFFELSTSAAFIIQSFWPINLYIIIGAATLFTPYLLYVLIKERKYGWIIMFFLLVLLPYPVLYLIIGEYILLPGWMLLPIISFLFLLFHYQVFSGRLAQRIQLGTATSPAKEIGRRAKK